MQDQRLDGFCSAYQEQFKFHDEDSTVLTQYARRIIQIIRARCYRSVLSLGLGRQIVARSILKELGASLSRYTVIEGSPGIVESFRSQVSLPHNLELVHSLFEDYQPAEKFDAIEIGFVLEHVDDPVVIVNRYSRFINSNGSIFIAVPNARSLHRLIGHESGLLDNLYRLSAEDLQLGHQRYFDIKSLSRLVLEAGLKIVNTEGLLLKPLTTGQLKSLNLPIAVVEGLLKVGANYPDISNAIFLEATT